MMHAASRGALAELRGQLEQLAGDGSATELASEIYAVADLLVGQPRLRRTLGDPSSNAEGRAGLVDRIFGSRISPDAVQILRGAVAQRWSSPWDLTDSLELLGDEALFAAAEGRGLLDEVEDELFRFERILAASGNLSTLLDDQVVPAQRRVALLDDVLGGKVARETLQMLEHAVASTRKRSVELAIDDLLEAAAERRNRSVARVLTAVELTDAQQSRLAAALSNIYGRPITVRTAVDPSIKGGLLIRVGDEVIDGSVASRFAQARTALAG